MSSHTNSSPNTPEQDEYQGTVVIPGEQEPSSFSLFLDRKGQAVTVRFGRPVAGSTDWEGSPVQVTRRLKYDEVVFTTTGLPKETVALTWKVNADHQDGTAAGVIVTQPNDQSVTGEKGFSLTRTA